MLNDPQSTTRDWLLLILSSPSGAGKTTLKTKLLAEFTDLRFSVSHTTRPPRAGEQDGREYHFVSQQQFQSMIDANSFAEHAEVHGNLYGTSLSEIEAAKTTHRGMIFDIDHQGARQLVARIPDAITIFVLPPSFEELESRLRRRADEPEDSIRRRLANARREIEHYGFFDYLVVNDSLPTALDVLRAIVLSERSRRWRRAIIAELLLDDTRTSAATNHT